MTREMKRKIIKTLRSQRSMLAEKRNYGPPGGGGFIDYAQRLQWQKQEEEELETMIREIEKS